MPPPPINENHLPSWQVWLVSGGTGMTELPAEEYGQFYGGDSYVVLHTYSTSPGEARPASFQ
jgi:hypothetical protein